MFRKILLLMVLFIFINSVHADSTYDPQTGNIGVSLNAGWNTVSTPDFFYTDCGKENIKAWYFYSPVNGWYGAYRRLDSPSYDFFTFTDPSWTYSPNNYNIETFVKELGITSLGYSNYYLHGINPIFWVYSKGSCQEDFTFKGKFPQESGTAEFASASESVSYELQNHFYTRKVTVKKGNNMISLLPWMMGSTYNEVFGNCTIERTGSWVSSGQQWFSPEILSVNMFHSNNQIPTSIIGVPFFAKFGSDCTLGVRSSGGSGPIQGGTVNPPNFPNQ